MNEKSDRKADELRLTEMNLAAETVAEPIQDSRPTLMTRRLRLRPLIDSDADSIQALVNDRQIARWCRSIDFPYPEGMARKWIEAHAQLWLSGKSAIFGISRLNDSKGTGPDANRLMGVIGLEISESDHHAELGYWLGASDWGAGYMTEAAIAIVDFGFTELGLHRIYASHMAGNDASGKVLQKCGMQHEGVLRNHVRKWGSFEDAICYGMLATDPRPQS